MTLPGNVVDATLAVIGMFSPVPPGQSGSRIFQYPACTRELAAAGFRAWEAFGFVTPLAYTPEAWRGRVRASARMAPVMDADTLGRFDAALAEELAARFAGTETLAVEHQVFGLAAWCEPIG